jgi:hypothetical protein
MSIKKLIIDNITHLLPVQTKTGAQGPGRQTA